MKRLLTLFVALVCAVALFSKEKNNGPFFPDTYNFKRGQEALNTGRYDCALECFLCFVRNLKSGKNSLMLQ
jgi:hypothetical protein